MDDSQVLAKLVDEFGFDKAQSYKAKLPLVRTYVQETASKPFPNMTHSYDFWFNVVTQLFCADISVPGLQDASQETKVSIVLHHLNCMHNQRRMYSPNGDGHFALLLVGVPGSGKTTLLTGLHAHYPPPDRDWETL